VIESILPEAAACAESFDGSPGAPLFPEEEALVSRAVDRRRQEFAAGRGCARSALSALGVPPGPILRSSRGAPQWPDGIVGSITHCAGYCAAAVARTADLLTIGLGAEPNAELPGGVLELISQPAERARLRELAAAVPGVRWDRLLFCAKESVYKAWFPLTRRWLGFEDATVTITGNAADPARGSFAARLLVPGLTHTGHPLTQLDGRWLRSGQLLITAIALSATQPR
jgi:4'-phosphopantetheinyl transferase EntD